MGCVLSRTGYLLPSSTAGAVGAIGADAAAVVEGVAGGVDTATGAFWSVPVPGVTMGDLMVGGEATGRGILDTGAGGMTAGCARAGGPPGGGVGGAGGGAG